MSRPLELGPLGAMGSEVADAFSSSNAIRQWRANKVETHKERILRYLQVRPAGADDDVIAAELGISHRQAVNLICRQLASEGIIVRRLDPTVGKIINQLAALGRRQSTALGTDSTPPVERDPVPTGPKVPRVGQITILSGPEAVSQFVYEGEQGLTEDQVKAAVESSLQMDGWTVDTRWGRAHGIDIVAQRGSERLILEAKGEGSLPAMRVNYFLGALGELLQRMDSPDAQYGLALPAHRQFGGLVLRLPEWIKARLHLHFFFVRQDPGGSFDVGFLESDEAREK